MLIVILYLATVGAMLPFAAFVDAKLGAKP